MIEISPLQWCRGTDRHDLGVAVLLWPLGRICRPYSTCLPGKERPSRKGIEWHQTSHAV